MILIPIGQKRFQLTNDKVMQGKKRQKRTTLWPFKVCLIAYFCFPGIISLFSASVYIASNRVFMQTGTGRFI